jgi:furin
MLYNNNNFSLNTFYRPNVNNYGTTSLYINRKQPKTTASPTSSGRKNGKQKQQKGKNNNNQRTSTTQRPIYTTVMLNQFVGGKSTKNKSKTTTNRLTSTTTTTKPSTKSQMNFDAAGKNNNLLLSVKGDKVQAANSNIHEKSPGKAPKQVKDFTTQSPMSKMFERYEKIQEIYPELKPYKDNNNPTYFTVSNGNGKPSRENSKSFSSFVSVNSAPQKKNSPSDERQTAAAANEKNGKGTNRLFIFANYLLFLQFY